MPLSLPDRATILVQLVIKYAVCRSNGQKFLKKICLCLTMSTLHFLQILYVFNFPLTALKECTSQILFKLVLVGSAVSIAVSFSVKNFSGGSNDKNEHLHGTIKQKIKVDSEMVTVNNQKKKESSTSAANFHSSSLLSDSWTPSKCSMIRCIPIAISVSFWSAEASCRMAPGPRSPSSEVPFLFT